ncbi:MAG: DUF362 domain-containing protein [Candidatus Saccharibacteria bacterium]
MASKVYFTDLQTGNKLSLLDKLEKLFDKADLAETIAPKDLVAIKLHFGEPGNLAYIRPQYVRRMVDKIKKLGGKPFLTDANTLYVGQRANAVDHLDSAIINGFDYAVVGAPLVIADGLTGKDYVKVPIDGKHFKEVNIGAAAYHADAMLVMTHFKCHELTAAGGAIKNVGMGLGSRSGKQQMHSDVIPKINEKMCKGCKKCTKWCPADAITMKEKKAVINEKKCWGCGECAVTCPHGSIGINWRTRPEAVGEKMAEYTLGAVANKMDKVGYINFVVDVSPQCDCYGFNDIPVAPNLGILASRDPVAIDQACIDLVNQAPSVKGCVIEHLAPGEDKFKHVHPGMDWLPQLEHAEKLGLGSRKYKLIEV